MHQTKMGNQWHFGIKAHGGVDEESGVIHTVMTTAAKVSDISQTPALLHGQEEVTPRVGEAVKKAPGSALKKLRNT